MVMINEDKVLKTCNNEKPQPTDWRGGEHSANHTEWTKKYTDRFHVVVRRQFAHDVSSQVQHDISGRLASGAGGLTRQSQ